MENKKKLASTFRMILLALAGTVFTSCSSDSPFYGHSAIWWVLFVLMCIIPLSGIFLYIDGDWTAGIIFHTISFIYFATMFHWWPVVLVVVIFAICAGLVFLCFSPLYVFNEAQLLCILTAVGSVILSVVTGRYFFNRLYFWGICFGPLPFIGLSWLICYLKNKMRSQKEEREKRKKVKKMEDDAAKREAEQKKEENKDAIKSQLEEIGMVMAQLESSIQNKNIDIRSLENLQKQIRELGFIDSNTVPVDYIKIAKADLKSKSNIIKEIANDCTKLDSYTGSIKVRFDEIQKSMEKIL